jgi:uncharacterized membrane protein YkoI
MKTRKRLIVAIVAALAAIGIGAGAVVAAGDDDDQPLKGDPRAKAMAAALEHVGGGNVIDTEVGDDGAAYGVEIRRPDGSVVEVNLDRDFRVIATEGDDDGPADTDDAGDD